MLRRILTLPLLALLVATTPRALAAQEAARRLEVHECGRLGIAFLPTDPPVVDQLLPGSPAHRAGIRPRDALIAVNGTPMSSERLPWLSQQLHPGRAVRLRILRDGRPREVEVVPVRDVCVHVIRLDAGAEPGEPGPRIATTDARRPGTGASRPGIGTPRVRTGAPVTPGATWRASQTEASAPTGAAATFFFAQRAVAGVEFTELSPELAAYFQGAGHGLLVLRVAPGTPGERTGFQPGDVVVAVDGEPVHDIAQLRAAVARAGRGPAVISIVRRGTEKKLEYRPEE